MSTLREAAQRALEALETNRCNWKEKEKALSLLRAALAEPPTDWEAVAADQAMTIALMKAEPVQEPVQEPVAWIQPNHLQKARRAPFLCRVEPTKRMVDFVALYTAPPQRKPLTEKEILEAVGWDIAEMYMKLTPNFPVAEAKKETLKNARAIERAHRIGGSDE